MNKDQLTEILEKHRLWLDDEEGGERANLDGAYLDGAYLDGANLRGANLDGAYLDGANLDGANLRGAYLRGANLDGANLRGAYLDGAYLDGANLDGANLRGAYLRGAYLDGAYLDGANLRGAYLDGANLRGAKLWGCSGNRNQIKSIFAADTYPITYTAEHLQIGCEKHLIEDWWKFDDRRIIEMNGKGALEWWKVWKPIIQNIIETSPATPTNYQAPSEEEQKPEVA